MAVETEEVRSSNWAVQYRGGRAHAGEIVAWMEETGGNGRYLEPQQDNEAEGTSAQPEFLVIYTGTETVLARKDDWIVLDAFFRFHVVTEAEYERLFVRK